MRRLIFVLSLLLTACAGAPVSTQVAASGSSIAPESVPGLAFNPADRSLLKADADGLFRLPADGERWVAIQTRATSGLAGIAFNPDDPATLYVSGFGIGVLKSTDGGQTWRKANHGLLTTQVTALALHSFRRETLYVWLNGDGIYRTEDGGSSWTRMPDQGPPDKEVRGLAHSTLPGSMNTGWLYAATPSGVYLSMDCF
jgi:photosystem II stability/assembly factor-like uncharacterized protein